MWEMSERDVVETKEMRKGLKTEVESGFETKDERGWS